MSRLYFQQLITFVQRLLHSRYSPSRRLVAGTLLVAGAIILFGSIGYIAYRVVSPYSRGNVQAQKVAQLKRTVAMQERERDELRRKKEERASNEGAVNIAIGEGWVRPNEYAVRFTPQRPEPELPSAPSTAGDATLGDFLLVGIVLCGLAFLTGGSLLLYRWRAIRARRPAGMLTPRSELSRR